MTPPPRQASKTQVIEETLEGEEPLTIDEVCQKVWARVGDRERNLVYQVLYRLREKGKLVTYERRYRIK